MIPLSQGEVLAAEILGLSWPFEFNDVLAAFRKTALVVHPDHGGDSRQFRIAIQARDLLREFFEGSGDRGRPASRPSMSWRSTQSGNITCVLNGTRVTVFRAKGGGFKWVRDGEFSWRSWSSQTEAMHDAEGKFG